MQFARQRINPALNIGSEHPAEVLPGPAAGHGPIRFTSATPRPRRGRQTSAGVVCEPDLEFNRQLFRMGRVSCVDPRRLPPQDVPLKIISVLSLKSSMRISESWV